MKVRVTITKHVNDLFRLAVNREHNREGLATREQVKAWYEDNATRYDGAIVKRLIHELTQEQPIEGE